MQLSPARLWQLNNNDPSIKFLLNKLSFELPIFRLKPFYNKAYIVIAIIAVFILPFLQKAHTEKKNLNLSQGHFLAVVDTELYK